jgi:hypothetical protein
MQKFSGAYSQQILAQFSIQELCGVVQSSDTQELTQHHVVSSEMGLTLGSTSKQAQERIKQNDLDEPIKWMQMSLIPITIVFLSS